jgi:transposase IS4-like protein
LNQSGMVTVPCLVTVAAGVFAPGHLGELTWYLPFELVDDVLDRTGAVQYRMRMLPSRVGMYFVLAMTLFPGIGYLRVWDKMTAALEDLGLPQCRTWRHSWTSTWTPSAPHSTSGPMTR